MSTMFMLKKRKNKQKMASVDMASVDMESVFIKLCVYSQI